MDLELIKQIESKLNFHKQQVVYYSDILHFATTKQLNTVQSLALQCINLNGGKASIKQLYEHYCANTIKPVVRQNYSSRLCEILRESKTVLRKEGKGKQIKYFIQNDTPTPTT